MYSSNRFLSLLYTLKLICSSHSRDHKNQLLSTDGLALKVKEKSMKNVEIL